LALYLEISFFSLGHGKWKKQLSKRERCVGSLVILKEPIRFLSVSMTLSMLVFASPIGGWRLWLGISIVGVGGFGL
jgi:hypothetical protein